MVADTVRAILFDLDDTLSGNDMDRFLRAYFGLLAPHVAAYVAPEKFMPAWLAATCAMVENTDPGVANSKTHPEYCPEIAGRIGRQPDECVMVGDDWGNDIAPAMRAGLRVYWVNAGAALPPGFDPRARGTLAEFKSHI